MYFVQLKLGLCKYYCWNFGCFLVEQYKVVLLVPHNDQPNPLSLPNKHERLFAIRAYREAKYRARHPGEVLRRHLRTTLPTASMQGLAFILKRSIMSRFH